MLTSTIKRNAFRVVATVAFAAAPAFASLIPITNPSFETLPGGGLTLSCGTGCIDSTAAIFGWTKTGIGPSGQVQPSLPFLAPDPSGGATSAFANGFGTMISQPVATVGVGTVYTLLVDIGERGNGPVGIGGSADLSIGGTVCGTCTATLFSGTPSVGGWATYRAIYTGTALDATKSITIELRNSDAAGLGLQGNFDSVSLTGVPEPASFLLIGSALLALKAFRRRRPIA
jgi:hypothetical protein